MIEFMRTRLRVVEEEFGAKFLRKKPDHELRPIGNGQHPVRFHWRTATRFLLGLRPGQTDLSDPSLAYIHHLSNTLESVSLLPGFDTEIRGRLKTWDKFEAAEYEMEIAALCKRAGTVEFVRRTDDRTPDLKVSMGEEVVWVECQRKARIVPTQLPPNFGEFVDSLVQPLLGDIDNSIDIIIMKVGFDEASIRRLITDIKNRIAENFRGFFSDRSASAAVLVRDDVPTYPGQLPGMPAAGWVRRRSTAIRVIMRVRTPQQAGPFEILDTKRFQTFIYDSNKFPQLLSGFDVKRQRKQFPEGEVGILAFRADLGNLERVDRDNYLIMISNMLANHAWAGGQNTRIGGIAISGSDFLPIVGEAGWRYLQPQPIVSLMKNRPDRLPHWFSLGGSPPLFRL